MFDSKDYPKPLDELVFEQWLETGRKSKISYSYMLVIWDELEEEYQPVFVSSRGEINSYERFGAHYTRQALVAAYDLYSESRVS